MIQMPGLSGSGVLEGAGALPEVPGEEGPSPDREAQLEGPTLHSAEFDACVEEIRNWFGSNLVFLFPRVEDQIRRRLGVAPLTTTAALLSGLVGVGVRLGAAIGATALVGEWAGIPWGRWTAILAFYALYDATQSWRTPPLDVPPGPAIQKITEEAFALLPTIVRESDLKDLADFLRRRYRLLPAVITGLTYAAAMVWACWIFTPTAMGEIPIGSIVLLAFLLCDVGAVVVYGGVIDGVLMAREARYEHRLFWPSPADSPEVQMALRTETGMGWATGIWTTIYLAMAVILVSWDSPAVVPLAVGFIVAAYLVTIGTTLWIRASIQKIVQRVKEQRLRGLRERIDDFGSSYTHLSPQESQELRDLLFLHHDLRDAPTTPTTARTLLHTALTLIIPTIMFLITVLGEVYTERIFDTILP